MGVSFTVGMELRHSFSGVDICVEAHARRNKPKHTHTQTALTNYATEVRPRSTKLLVDVERCQIEAQTMLLNTKIALDSCQ